MVHDFSNHSLYMIQLFNSNCLKGNFEGNHLLDGTIYHVLFVWTLSMRSLHAAWNCFSATCMCNATPQLLL